MCQVAVSEARLYRTNSPAFLGFWEVCSFTAWRLKIARSPVQPRDCPLDRTLENSVLCHFTTDTPAHTSRNPTLFRPIVRPMHVSPLFSRGFAMSAADFDEGFSDTDPDFESGTIGAGDDAREGREEQEDFGSALLPQFGVAHDPPDRTPTTTSSRPRPTRRRRRPARTTWRGASSCSSTTTAAASWTGRLSASGTGGRSGSERDAGGVGPHG
jgi:hypothetical protein